MVLTDAGTLRVKRSLYNDVSGPQRLPYAVVTAPMASGNTVVKNAKIWPSLGGRGQRKLAAIEMEAATVATIARDREVPQWLVVKGVMDHGDEHKDDRYKGFAARASAEVMFALIGTLMARGSDRYPTASPQAPRSSRLPRGLTRGMGPPPRTADRRAGPGRRRGSGPDPAAGPGGERAGPSPDRTRPGSGSETARPTGQTGH